MTDDVLLEVELTDPLWRLGLARGEVVVVDGAVDRLLGVVDGSSAGGQVRLAGRRLRGDLSSRVRAGLAVVRAAEVAPQVSVVDHLAAGVGAARAAAALDGAPLLSGRGSEPAGVLSGGERVVLAWLRAAALPVTAVVVDRATAGLDAEVRTWAAGQVEAWTRAGRCVLVAPSAPGERAWGRPVTVPG